MISWLRSILHPTTVKLYPGYEDMLPFMQSLPEAFAHGEGLLIHDGRNQLRILEYGSREYVVKSYQVPIFFNRQYPQWSALHAQLYGHGPFGLSLSL